MRVFFHPPMQVTIMYVKVLSDVLYNFGISLVAFVEIVIGILLSVPCCSEYHWIFPHHVSI